MNEIIPLHIHSEKSMLDGVEKIDDIAKHIKENENLLNVLSISEHGTLRSQFEAWEIAEKHGLKFQPAIEIYFKPRMHEKGDETYHLLLFGWSEKSYRELIKLQNEAVKNGQIFNRKVYWTFEQVKKLKHNYLSGACIGGYWHKPLVKNNVKESKHRLNQILSCLSKKQVLLEYQVYNLDDTQKRINIFNNKVSKELGLKPILASDAHAIKRKDTKYITLAKNMNFHQKYKRQLHENNFIKDINDFMNINRKNDMQIESKVFTQFSVFSRKLFGKIEKMSLKREQKFNKGGKKENLKLFDELLEKAFEKETNRLDERRERLEYEKEIIKDMGFVDYFLYVREVVELARDNDILVGAGRGSAVGSYVNYLLGITWIDPLKHNLMFERFLSRNRAEAPDIDVDFSDRGKLIKLLDEKHKDKEIVTIGSKMNFSLKSLLRIIFKTFNVRTPFEDYHKSSDFYSDLITKHGIETLDNIPEECKEEFNKIEEYFEQYIPEFTLKETIDKFLGNLFTVGTHAGGILLLTPGQTNVPYGYCKKEGYSLSSEYSESGSIRELEDIGEIKFDFLAVRSLQLVTDCLALTNVDIDVKEIDFNDKEVFELIKTGVTDGLFQISSYGMKQLIKDFEPNNLEELIMLIAIYRPGCLQAGIDKKIITNKQNDSGADGWDNKLLEHIEPIIKTTYYQVIYQEQVMQIGQVIGDYSPKDLNDFRKFISNKHLKESKPKLYKQLYDKFYNSFVNNGCAKGINKSVLENLWEDLKNYSLYSFNRSHASAYGYLTYITAYCFKYYPAEFYASLLRKYNDLGGKNKNAIAMIPKLQGNIKKLELDIEITAPKISSNSLEISVVDNRIILPAHFVKGVGMSKAKKILKGNDTSYNKKLLHVGFYELNKADWWDAMYEAYTKTMPKYIQKEYKSEYMCNKAKYWGKMEKDYSVGLKDGEPFNIKNFIGDYDKFRYLEEMKLLGFTNFPYIYKEKVKRVIGGLIKETPLLFTFKYKIINEITSLKEKTTTSGKPFYMVRGKTPKSKTVFFNIFQRERIRLRNLFEHNINNHQDYIYLLFYKRNGKYINLINLIPIKK